MRKIESENAPAAIGPYSQGVQAGHTLYLSGQIGINPDTGKLEGTTTAAQAEQVMRNIEAILKEAGMSMRNVVKTTCFLTDISTFAAFNEVYAEHFTSKPARSCVAVSALPAGALCEIEVIASAE